jgi:hypothetical protein
LGRFRTLRRSQILNSHHNLGTSPTGLPRTSPFRNSDGPSVEEPQVAKSSTYNYLSRRLDQRLAYLTLDSIIDNTTAETAGTTTPENGHQIHEDGGKFRHWANAFRRGTNIPPRIIVRQGQRRQTLRISGQVLSLSAHSPSRFHFSHTKRLSNSSSGFVETVKAASLSKASISI